VTVKHYHRLSPDTSGEFGQMTLRDLRALATKARALGAPLDESNVTTESRDQLHRFSVPAVEWSEEV
jgi:hypothetical protein